MADQAPASGTPAPAAASGTPAPVAASGTPAPAAAGAGAAFDWAQQGLDTTTLGYVQNKGFKTVGDAIGSYINLEKLVGVPADQVIKLPKEMTPETMAPIYDRLGRPKAATDYKIPVPEGMDTGFAKAAGEWFHSEGLNQKQVEGVVGKWNEHVKGLAKADADKTALRDQTETAALKVEWGAQYQANEALVERAASAFGMTKEQLTALREVMGPAASMKFMQQIGSKLGVSDEFKNGGGTPPGFGGMTPAQALAKIEANRKDQEFVKKFIAGDAAARAEMEKLHKAAYPES